MATGSELPTALRAAHQAWHRRSEAAFARPGATAAQFVLPATLSRGHALTQRELARRMPADPSTVRAVLAQFGLAWRLPSSRHNAVLTRSGEAGRIGAARGGVHPGESTTRPDPTGCSEGAA